MTAAEAAAVLAEIALLTEITDGDSFRARAYQQAARRLETSGADLDALAREGRLTSLPGVGKGIAEVIREIVETGRSSLYERLAADTPPGLYEVMRVKGLGAKRVRTLYADLGVDSLDALEKAARAGKVASLPGFGAKTEQQVLAGLAFARAARGRRRLPAAQEAAERLLEWLRTVPSVRDASVAGEVRRRLEIVESIDLVASSESPEDVLGAFRALGSTAASVESAAEHAEMRLSDGLLVRLACVPPARYAAALVRWTGSADHLKALEKEAKARKLVFGDDGLVKGKTAVKTPDEEAFYRALGLAWIPPELREGWGEVEAAAKGTLPKLVELADLRGTFHCHTTYSDGKATLAEMAEAARWRGWRYLGIADHSQAASYAGGLPPRKVKEQHAAIDAWNREHGGKGKKRFRLFKGIESDILADGRLDYDDDVLASFDYVVGSVHSAFKLPEKEQTARLVRAVSHPRITMLGHATGRLLLSRSGYEVDVRAVIDAAAEHGTAVEINADPHRLDIDWRHARYAAERGVLVPVNPDAHSESALDNVAWGVNVARKGWLSARQVLNAWDLEEVETYFAERKQGRAP